MGAGHDLASVVQDRMHQVARHWDTQWGELGTVQSDGSLQVARLNATFPRGQYQVARHLRQAAVQAGLMGVTDDTSGQSLQHTHLLPALTPGDTVVVLYVAGGAQPVVVAAL